MGRYSRCTSSRPAAAGKRSPWWMPTGVLEWHAVSAHDPHEKIRATSSGRFPRRASWAALVRLVRDLGLAEELAQDALVAALEQWPESGIPNNPGAWLQTAAARHRAINVLRRKALVTRKHEQPAPLERERERIPVRISRRGSTTRWATTCCVSS